MYTPRPGSRIPCHVCGVRDVYCLLLLGAGSAGEAGFPSIREEAGVARGPPAEGRFLLLSRSCRRSPAEPHRATGTGSCTTMVKDLKKRCFRYFMSRSPRPPEVMGDVMTVTPRRQRLAEKEVWTLYIKGSSIPRVKG